MYVLCYKIFVFSTQIFNTYTHIILTHNFSDKVFQQKQ